MSKARKKPAAKPRQTPKPEHQVSESEPYAICDTTATKCPNCGSIERSEYNNLTTTDGPVRIMGVMYAKVERRRTSCLNCGRRRIDRTLYPLTTGRT